MNVGPNRSLVVLAILLSLSVGASAATYYVRESGTGDGSSWANSMSNLQLAIELCQTDGGGEVWVAAGIYKPFGWPNYGSGARAVHFSLRNGVTVYGGFPATGTPVMGDRDIDTYVTRCSGDVGVSGDDSDNAFHVFYHPTGAVLNASAVMDGLWITDGRAEASGGGGMYMYDGSPTITHCVFSNNEALLSGGGIYLRGSTSVVLTCRFINNAAKDGGGLYVYNGWPGISDCVFTGNTASAGGGLYGNAGRISRSRFEYNKGGDPDSAFAGGGAMHVAMLELGLENDIIVENCIFVKNNVYDQSADDNDAKGGAVYTSHHTYFVNCVFMSNSVAGEGTATYHDYNGGGVFSRGGGSGDLRRGIWSGAPVFRNCIFYRNTAEAYGGGVAVDYACTSLDSCTIVRNTAEKGGGLYAKQQRGLPWGTGGMDNSIVRANSGDGSWYDDIYTPDEGSGHGSQEATFRFSHDNATYKTGTPDGSGNIDTAVDFVDIDDPDGPDDTWFTADDGLALQGTSTCIDAGANESRGEDPLDLDGDNIYDEPCPLDILGNMRVSGGTIDMGAYEYASTTPPTHTVEFDLTALGTWAGGGALTQEVFDGGSAVPPEVTPDPSYFHTGWDVDFTRVTNDLVVTAQYTQTVFVVTFDPADHGDARSFSLTVTVEPGANVCWTPPIIPHEGWYHTGWSEPLTNIMANVTNVAQYEAIVLTSNRCYVKEGTIGSGASWIDAMGDLQQAIETVAAVGTGEVWVAAGTFAPRMTIHSSGWEIENYHFSLRNNVTVYGGFPATGTPGMGDRDPLTNLTVCSGWVELLCGETVQVYNVFYHPEAASIDSSAVLDGVVIEKGNAVGFRREHGGAMYNYAASPMLRNCLIRDNYARLGGGVYNKHDPSPTFLNCRFEDNSANTFGGAMRNYGSSPMVSNCMLSGNTADFGGSMANDSGQPALIASLFLDNTAADWGGAIYNGGAPVSIYSCAFVSNVADSGGGVYNDMDSHAKFVSTLFSHNAAAIDGGAVYNIGDSSPMFVNCTLSSNVSVTGGGIMNWNAHSGLTNSIVWGNPGGNLVLLAGSTASVVSCIIEGGYGTATNGLDEDPLFTSPANPAGADGEWFTADDGLMLMPLSPAVNAGSDTNMALDLLDIDGDGNTVEAMMFDIAWTDRLIGVHVDMGAYEDPTPKTYVVSFGISTQGTWVGGGGLTQTVEVHGAATAPILSVDVGWAHTGWTKAFDDVTRNFTVNAKYEFRLTNNWTCYVRENGEGDMGGTTWSNAAPDLQDCIEALSAAGSGQVWVAEGTYMPASWPNGGAEPRARHFSLRNKVTVLGGFIDQGDPGIGDRDVSAYPTVLSGDRGAVGVSTDNTFHVFYHPSASALDSIAVLDGFTIIDGNANSAAPNDAGGGMYNNGASPSVRNCTFRRNYGHYGGGVYNGSLADPQLTWCVVESNSALYGGGIFNRDGAAPSLVDVAFCANAAGQNGGGAYNNESVPSFVQCAFVFNVATNGGAIYNYAAPPDIRHCVITLNGAVNTGGGIYNASTSAAAISETIIWGNTATDSTNFHEGGVANSVVTNCIIQGGFGGDTNVVDSDPCFTDNGDPDGADDAWFTADDGLYLSYLSPAINAGDTSALPADGNDVDEDDDRGEILPLDLGGRERVSGLIVDLGPYETVTHVLDFDLGSFGTWIGGGALTQQVAHGGAAEAPEVMLEVGWDLVGWVPSYSNITADTTVIAMYGQAFSAGDICYIRTDGTGSGASWDEAAWNLQGGVEAIAETGSGQVWVAAGTYTPQDWPNGGSAAREVHFSLRNNVRVYGGFPASGDPGMSNRDPRVYNTVLSGNVGLSGTATDNTYHVFYHAGTNAELNSSARLDGFSIISGYADGSGDHQYGGGMLNDEASPMLVRCHFSGNIAYNGAGLWNWDATPVLASCIFRANGAGNYGGGICNNYSSAPVIINGLFLGNTANDGGGMLNDTGCNPELYACTFADNSATNYGGAIANGFGAEPMLRTCIIWSNTASSGNSIYATVPADTDVDTCLIEGGWASGTNVLDTNPVFNAWSDPDGPDKVWRTSDDGLMLSNASPAYEYSATALLPADLADLDGDGDTGEALSLDLRETPRVAGLLLDLGCYESDADDLQDYGDAPASYGTLLVDQGARHALVAGGPFMGAGVEADVDGQPSAGADQDDDDGAWFPGALVRTYSATVRVDASASTVDAKFNMWIDYNQDGIWQTNWYDEHVIVNGNLLYGMTNSFVFMVESNAVVGQTYARMRCDTSGGLSPLGGAADGEVEDYLVTICQPDPGDIDLDYVEHPMEDKWVLHWNITNAAMVGLQGTDSIETNPITWTDLDMTLYQDGDLQFDVSQWLFTLRFFRIRAPYIYWEE